MEIRFRFIDNYIHAYEVEGLHAYLSQFEEEFYNLFKKQLVKGNEEIANIHIQNQELNKFLVSIFNTIVKKYYLVGESIKEVSPMLYSQTNKFNQPLFHNHINTGNITSTTYLNPTSSKEGGGLEFLLHENNQIVLQPKPNMIYFFPGWLLHRPLPQEREKVRYCINWGYDGPNRPIHKLTGDRW